MPAIDWNYHVALVLDNEPGSYYAVRALVAAAMLDGERDARELGRELGLAPNVDGSIRRVAGERLRDHVETLIFGDDGDVVSDSMTMTWELLGCAVASVDWDALADRYVDAAREGN